MSKALMVIGLMAYSVLLAYSANHMAQAAPVAGGIGLCAAILAGAAVAEALGTSKILSGQNGAAGLIFMLTIGVHYISWHTSTLVFVKGIETEIAEQRGQGAGMNELRHLTGSLFTQLNQVDKTSERAILNQQILQTARELKEGTADEGATPAEQAMEKMETDSKRQGGMIALAMELVSMALGIALGDYVTRDAGFIRRRKDKPEAKKAPAQKKKGTVKPLQLVQPKTLGGEAKMSIPATKFVERQKDEIPDMMVERPPHDNTRTFKRKANQQEQYELARDNNCRTVADIKRIAGCAQKRAEAIRDQLISESLWKGQRPRRVS